MKTIWKFELETTDVQNIMMPGGAKILCVQTQRSKPNLWAEVDPYKTETKRTIEMFGTGHDLPQATRQYIGTFQLSDLLVFHVYERL